MFCRRCVDCGDREECNDAFRNVESDRAEVKHDYEVNMKAELEIELLHDKMNLLREQEIVELKTLITEQQQQIEQIKALLELNSKQTSANPISNGKNSSASFPQT